MTNFNPAISHHLTKNKLQLFFFKTFILANYKDDPVMALFPSIIKTIIAI